MTADSCFVGSMRHSDATVTLIAAVLMAVMPDQ